MKMRKIWAALAAAALVAALLAGCAKSSSSSMSSSMAPSSSSMATSEGASSSGAASSGATSNGTGSAASDSAMSASSTPAAAYDSAALTAVLDKAVEYQADSAGGSLKNAQVAGELARFAATCPTDCAEKVKADASAWAGKLTTEQKAALNTNWPSISETAKAISADPASQKELLDTAGANSDFANLDLSKVPDVVDALSAVLNAQK